MKADHLIYRLRHFFVYAGFLSGSMLVSNLSGAENSRSSSFLNAVGGLLNRQPTQTSVATNINNTNRASAGLLVLDSLLSHPAQTNTVGTNTLLLADRLGTFLGGADPGTNNASVSTNLVQKLRDWLQAQQSSGTNSSTNTATQRSWAALTNALAANVSTNSASSNSLTGTNLVQKLRDWVAREQQTQTNATTSATNNASGALSSLAALFNNATNQVATNVSTLAQTNSTPAGNLLRGLGNFFDRQKSGHK